MGGKSPKASALGERRRTGVYYTPPYLARFLCRESLSRFVATRSSLPLDDAERFIACEACSDVPASISSRLDLIDSSLRGVSVIDPAVGTGVMLVTMLEELVNARVKIYKSAGREPPVEDFYEAAIVNSLHGVDINTEAVQTARSAIIGSRADDNGTTAAGVSAAMGSHIVAGNALAEIGKSIDHGIFDIVISNPPYLSYYGNAPVRIGEAEKHSLREDYDLFSQSNQRINAMNLFIELGVKLLKEGGILSYVVNKTLCVLPSYRKTRAYLLSNCTINRLVVDLDPFDAIVDCATLCVSKTKPPPNYTLSWCSLKGIPTNPASLASAIASRQMRIPVNQFARNRRLEFTYSPHEPILQKLERAAHRL
ncbi:MAG: N-6 DNA methylase, partial [Candidatus Lokiarchaeota archaeon]|nr:N-6 DNA methylase [Candidatus Lokiarchaeota archaeon]